MSGTLNEMASPRLSRSEIDALRPLAEREVFTDGQYLFRAGQEGLDLFVVESGRIDILNPADDGKVMMTYEPGAFSGDIDLLTRRPPMVSGIARGGTQVLRVPGRKMRELLNRIPRFGEKLMTAFTTRRELLIDAGAVNIRVLGPAHCKDTALVKEFLHKNFVPFAWFDTETAEGQQVLVSSGSPGRAPIVIYGDGRQLLRPSLIELAESAGIWQVCPDQNVDLAVIGAGPAGIAAAVYAASEGLSTVVLDRIGPGGQVAGSSRVENFVGFPAGLSGTELATRGVLQMLKFGARMIAPVTVQTLLCSDTPGEQHTIRLDCGASIKAPAVLIATGVRWRRLDAKNADRFDGAGIYYVCTSVEALLYDRSAVGVVGGGNSAGQAAMYLAECCGERDVHLIIRKELGRGMSQYLVERIRATPNIIVHNNSEITEVDGDCRLREIKIKAKGTINRIPCEAVFVFIGAEPSVAWLPECVARDRLGYLLTGADAARSGKWPLKDRDPCPVETTAPGILAAGDIRSGSTKRVGFAIGDGSLAVTCVHHLRALAQTV